MSKPLIYLLVLVAVFLLGGGVAYRLFKTEDHVERDSTVLLEKIEEVYKLITVQGQFSEIYNYSEYQGYFTLLWDKKALVRVRATVSAGYDLKQITTRADSLTRTIYISALPQPQILSIDHTLDYYDISNGLFTSFSPQDYNRINADAKEMIRKKAEPVLLPAAARQADKVMEMIRFMVESAGWKLVIATAPPPAKG